MNSICLFGASFGNSSSGQVFKLSFGYAKSRCHGLVEGPPEFHMVSAKNLLIEATRENLS